MPKAQPLLLDLFPNAAVAYSLRKLRTAYTGSAIRVRRSSDNTEQDINFVGGDLDTQSLLDFVGYNLWTYSEDISQAVWTKGNLNTTGAPAYIDVETAPDGLTTGDKLIENTTTNFHSILRTNSVTSGLEYNVSVYLKQAERTKVQISSSISNSPQTCDVDLINGTVSNNGFANTPIVTSESNGWYRFSITITSGTTGSYNTLRINLYNDLNATNYTGDGTSGAYVWGFQLTQSSTVLPYTKTVATVAGNGFVTTWYDQSGNANNAAQATATTQAQIVSVGAIITDPNTGKISVTWTNDNYPLTSTILLTQNLLMTSVINRNTINNTLVNIGNSGTTNQRIVVWLNNTNSNVVVSQFNNILVTHETGNTSIGAFIMSGLRDSSSVVKAWRNTSALTTGVASGGVGSGIFNRFATASTLGHTGSMVEMIYWDNDKESSRADIVTNQNDYWEVY
jgi:hypothetical protein